MDALTEKQLIDVRTSGWFAEFVQRTDEKEVTAGALAEFLMNLRRTNLVPQFFFGKPPSVLDVGTGTGHLSAQIKAVIEEMNGEGVDYNGIEYDPRFAAQTQRKIRGGVVMPGDGFASAENVLDSLQMGDKPDMIVGSHSFMYSPDLAKSVENIRDLMKPSSIAIFVNLSPDADTVTVTKGFAQDMGAETDAIMVRNFRILQMPTQTIKFRARMYFPEVSEELWQELREAKPYDDKNNPHAAHKDGLVVRKMVEFVLQRPLEALGQDDRNAYLGGIQKKLRVQGNALYLDNIVEVAVSPNSDKQTKRAVELAATATSRNLEKQMTI